MINQKGLEFLGKKRRINLRGTCLELLPICEALCCRDWNVNLTRAEGKNGTYLSDKICLLTEKECDKDRGECAHLEYRLQKKDDRSCVYINGDSTCSIYDRRPRVCRDFSCQGGWRLDSVSSVDSEKGGIAFTLTKADFIAGLKNDMTFILHPLLKIHSIFCIQAKGEIVFLKEFIGNCGKFYTKDEFLNTKLDERRLFELLNLFARKDTLEDVYRLFSSQVDILLSQKEFYEIVWLFNKHQLILNSVHFAGMLKGMGRL